MPLRLRLFFSRDSIIQALSIGIVEFDTQTIPRQRHGTKPQFGHAISAVVAPSTFPTLSPCPRHEVIDPISGEVLKVVLVSADIRPHVIRVQNRKQAVPEFRCISVKWTGGIDRMVTKDEFPHGS